MQNVFNSMANREKEHKIPDGVADLVGKSIARVSQDESKSGKSLIFQSPEKLAKVLVSLGRCESRSQIMRKHGVNAETLSRIAYEHREELGGIKMLFGREMAVNAQIASDTLMTAFEDYEGMRQQWEQENPGKPFPVSAKDLKDLTLTMTKMGELAMAANGEASQITEDRRKLSIEDAKALRDQLMGKAIEAEEVNEPWAKE